MSVLAVVGAGPGIGTSVARRFGHEGFAVGLVSRSAEHLASIVDDLEARGVRATAAAGDATRPDRVRAALKRIATTLGPVDVLCFSPLADISLIKPVVDTTAEDVEGALALTVVGAVAATTAVLPAMRRRRSGTVLFTTGGAAVNPHPDRAVSAIVYSAQGSYMRMLHESVRADGVHVAQVVIVGAVGHGMTHEPDTVAEHLWRQHDQRDDAVTVLG